MRPELETYEAWLSDTLKISLDGHTKRHYLINANNLLNTCQSHPFFKSLEKTLERISTEYESATGARLFSDDPRINLDTKSYESAVNKSYRQNVVLNKSFPKPPKGGWVTPESFFESLNDIVRACLVCRYLDGPEFVAARLESVAKAENLEASYVSIQHDRGYYAYHLYLKILTPLIAGEKLVSVEIQLTTHLQDIVRDLTHRFYEELRTKERAAQREHAWKWEYKTARFKAGYLSHTLHLLEGLIAEIRGERSAPVLNEENHEHSTEAKAADASSSAPSDNPQAGSDGRA